MKLIFPAVALAAVLAAGCAGNKTVEDTADAASNEAVITTDILGKWDIQNISLADTLGIRPAEIDPESPCAMIFLPDSTFGASTNCNGIGGTYILSGSEIKFDHLSSTMMLCPDTRIEESINSVLPQISSYAFEGDSILLLNTTDPARFIELRRSAVQPDESED